MGAGAVSLDNRLVREPLGQEKRVPVKLRAHIKSYITYNYSLSTSNENQFTIDIHDM